MIGLNMEIKFLFVPALNRNTFCWSGTISTLENFLTSKLLGVFTYMCQLFYRFVYIHHIAATDEGEKEVMTNNLITMNNTLVTIDAVTHFNL